MALASARIASMKFSPLTCRRHCTIAAVVSTLGLGEFLEEVLEGVAAGATSATSVPGGPLEEAALRLGIGESGSVSRVAIMFRTRGFDKRPAALALALHVSSSMSSKMVACKSSL
jgi:hypothetical protein